MRNRIYKQQTEQDSSFINIVKRANKNNTSKQFKAVRSNHIVVELDRLYGNKSKTGTDGIIGNHCSCPLARWSLFWRPIASTIDSFLLCISLLKSVSHESNPRDSFHCGIAGGFFYFHGSQQPSSSFTNLPQIGFMHKGRTRRKVGNTRVPRLEFYIFLIISRGQRGEDVMLMGYKYQFKSILPLEPVLTYTAEPFENKSPKVSKLAKRLSQ